MYKERDYSGFTYACRLRYNKIIDYLLEKFKDPVMNKANNNE